MNSRTQQNREKTPSPRALSPQEMNSKSPDADQKSEMGSALSWTVWPVRENPLRSTVLILFLMAVVWAISSWFGAVWIVLASIILLGSLGSFFFPTLYRLGPETVSARGLLSRKTRTWSGLKKYYVGNKGVHLSPYSKPSRLESFRGIYLPFGEKREEVVEFIEEKMNRGR